MILFEIVRFNVTVIRLFQEDYNILRQQSGSGEAHPITFTGVVCRCS